MLEEIHFDEHQKVLAEYRPMVNIRVLLHIKRRLLHIHMQKFLEPYAKVCVREIDNYRQFTNKNVLLFLIFQNFRACGGPISFQ